jgi:hypothetical protein
MPTTIGRVVEWQTQGTKFLSAQVEWGFESHRGQSTLATFIVAETS